VVEEILAFFDRDPRRAQRLALAVAMFDRMLRNVVGPAGDDELVFTVRDLPGAAFDPVSEELSFVFRDDQGTIVNAVIPANSPGWVSSANERDYTDPAGAFGGIVSVALRATPVFSTRGIARPSSA
jgi:hypothetical protein